MRIYQFNNCQFLNKSSFVSFASTRLQTTTNNGNEYCNYTNMNREDVDWKKFVHFIDKKYKNQDKVKINCFACSDGSEPYSLAIHLINELGIQKAKKFLPIEASDISEPVINEAKAGNILLHPKDLDFINNSNASDFFKRDYSKPSKIIRNIEFYPYKVSSELRKCVNFSVENIYEKVKRQKFHNQIVMFRNGWTFNDLNTQNEIAKNLNKASNESTLILIGQSDLFKSGASDFLQQNGFRGIKSDIYTEKETDYPSETIGQPKNKPIFPEFILFQY